MIASCNEKHKNVEFDFPPIQELPEKRNMFEGSSSKYANDHATEFAESQYCNCLRKSVKKVWDLCEEISDEKFTELLKVQQSEMIKNTMIRAYLETKNRCKLQKGLIKKLPDIDNI